VFEVTAVRGWLPSKLVELTAIDNIRGIKLLGNGIRGGVFRCPYHFPKGAQLILTYPPWRHFNVGEHIDTATVLKHPSVQRELSRNWESRA
jgi:hypothetical protein